MHLVTGGSGVLGRALIEELIRLGKPVRIFDLKPPPGHLAENVEYIQGNIMDREAVIAACKGIEVVHHLAASMPQARLSARGFWEINVGGTLNLVDGCLTHNIRRLVYASTIELYGVHTEFPVREDSEKRFTGIYSRNKWEIERRLLAVREQHGLEVVFPRMPMIFGPGFYHEQTIITLFKFIKKGWTIPIPGYPKAPWASVASPDVASAFLLCAQVPEADGQAFNIAAADAPACDDTLHELCRRLGSKSKTAVIPKSVIEPVLGLAERYDLLPVPAELIRFAFTGGVYSIDKAKKILGYKPQFSAVEGMELCYRWMDSEARA